VTVAVHHPVNQAPVAAEDGTYTAQPGEVLTIDALANDYDPDGDPLTVRVIDPPLHGTVTAYADGTFDYLPAEGYRGEDFFSYVSSDGAAESNPVAVRVRVPADPRPVNFAGLNLQSYGGQDTQFNPPVAEDRSGLAIVTPSGSSLTLSGNRWKAIDIPLPVPTDEDSGAYTITLRTLLTFNFSSKLGVGEIQGIGLDNQTGQTNPQWIFNLNGTETWGIQDYRYTRGDGLTQQFVIPVGRYFTGDFTKLVFVNDHDFVHGSPDVPNNDPNSSQCTFSAVRLYEAPDDAQLSLHVDGQLGRQVTPYGGAAENDDPSARAEVGSSGYALSLNGNTWRKVRLQAPVRLTAQSVIQFTFSSNSEGRVHGIGFDNDDTITADDARYFLQVYGTGGWGRLVDDEYTQPGTSVTYTINLGQYFGPTFQGNFRYITFANDDDGEAFSTADSRYSYINLSPGGGPVNHPPEAYDDSYTVVTGRALAVAAGQGLLRNAEDPDNQVGPRNAGLSVVVPAQQDPIRVAASGAFRYTPPPGFTGLVSFTSRVRDQGGKLAVGTVTIGVLRADGYLALGRGNVDNNAAAPGANGGYVFAGGGKDQDEVIRWIIENAAGGDIVVLRTNYSLGYNDYFWEVAQAYGLPLDSVETIIFNPDDPMAARNAANLALIQQKILDAEAVFIAGGDQTKDFQSWTNTLVRNALRQRIGQQNFTIGGTSAGLHVLSQTIYTAPATAQRGITSAQALQNIDHDPLMHFDSNFLNVNLLAGVVADTHFANRNRMGRLLAFMAHERVNGLGVDEATAILVRTGVDGGDDAEVVGAGQAYFLNRQNLRPTARRPLSFGTQQAPVFVRRLGLGATFWFADAWDPQQTFGLTYSLWVVGGDLRSSRAGNNAY
jgi:cyanophycinase